MPASPTARSPSPSPVEESKLIARTRQPGSASAESSPAAATPSEDTDGLRGKAVEAMAHMGQAVGLEVFREDAHQVRSVLVGFRGKESANARAPFGR